MAFGIKRKRGNVQECITKDFKSKCIVNCSSLLLKISLLRLSWIPSPLGIFYCLLFRYNYKNELPFPMDSFINSISHSIVAFGTVETPPCTCYTSISYPQWWEKWNTPRDGQQLNCLTLSQSQMRRLHCCELLTLMTKMYLNTSRSNQMSWTGIMGIC